MPFRYPRPRLTYMKQVIVIGAGPAGLMAAEILADRGHAVRICEARPSVARKLLMAGKSGLNLTKDESFDDFLAAYGTAAEWLRPYLSAFSNTDVKLWAEALGQEVFTGSTGRVFPKTMKASPLLRAWLARLERKGVTFHTRWRWTGWQAADLCFDTPEGQKSIRADTTVLALGGASWARLGSDGLWADMLTARDIPVVPFQPANMGFTIDWSPHMHRHFGLPVKNCALLVGTARHRGEFILSAKGLEGGGIYTISRALRDGA